MERKKKKTYYLVCRDYTKSINPKIVRNRENRYIVQSNCANCGIKKSRFINEQKALGIFSNLGIKTPLSQVPLLNILFYYNLKDETYCLSCKKDTIWYI